MGGNHGEDEDEEESVVTLTDAAVEEKAVVVVVFNAHVTQLTVFCIVRLEQLGGTQGQGKKQSNGEEIQCQLQVQIVLPHSMDRTCEGSGCFPPGQQCRRSEDLHLLCLKPRDLESKPCRRDWLV